MVKFALKWSLTFPYNYVREIKLIKNFKAIKTIDVTEARHYFYSRSNCILRNKKQNQEFEIDKKKIKC